MMKHAVCVNVEKKNLKKNIAIVITNTQVRIGV